MERVRPIPQIAVPEIKYTALWNTKIPPTEPGFYCLLGQFLRQENEELKWKTQKIMVDLNSERITGLYYDVKRMIDKNGGGEFDESNILMFSFWHACQSMHYSKKKADFIAHLARIRTENEKEVVVPLDQFLEKGVGKCVQYACVTAAILLRFQKDGLLLGDIVIKQGEDMIEGKLEGHAWAEYRSPNDNILVLDASAHYLGIYDSEGKKLEGSVVLAPRGYVFPYMDCHKHDPSYLLRWHALRDRLEKEGQIFPRD